jgi:hypothetical protein
MAMLDVSLSLANPFDSWDDNAPRQGKRKEVLSSWFEKIVISCLLVMKSRHS